MIKRILVIYSTEKNKREFEVCEKVIKKVFQRFRKPVNFSYISADVYSLENALSIVESESCDAIITDINNEIRQSIVSLFNAYATLHTISGRSIISPSTSLSFKSDDASFGESFTASSENIKKSIIKAFSLAESGKREVCVCTSSRLNLANEYFFDLYESISNKYTGLSHSAKTLSEFSLGGFIFPDVVLTDIYSEEAIVMNAYSKQLQKLGYTCILGKIKNVYCHEMLPDDDINCGKLSRILMAYSGIIETELGFKTDAQWLRRAVSLSRAILPICTEDKFIEIIIDFINKKMRNRQAVVK